MNNSSVSNPFLYQQTHLSKYDKIKNRTRGMPIYNTTDKSFDMCIYFY